MNIPEKIEIWKRKIVELEKEISSLEKGKSSLINLSNDVKSGQNIKLENSLEGINLEEEITYINDWIDFHNSGILKYKNKIANLEKKSKQEEQQDLEKIKEGVKLLFEEKPKRQRIQFRLGNPLKSYAAVFIVLALIASVFLLKPAITGQVVLGKETAHTDNLNLVMNESGAYEWQVKSPGDIKSIKASGSVIGNGTVKIYIEKDGKRYLIFDNKNK